MPSAISMIDKVAQGETPDRVILSELDGVIQGDSPSDYANIVGEVRDILQTEVLSYLQAIGAEEERELAASIGVALSDLMTQISSLPSNV
jgi:hypothetical protein